VMTEDLPAFNRSMAGTVPPLSDRVAPEIRK
jgi:hypothetical protein